MDFLKVVFSKKKFLVFAIFAFLLGLVSSLLIVDTKNKGERSLPRQEETGDITPQVESGKPTGISGAFFALNFPIEYSDLVIDYLKEKNTIIVYYPESKLSAQKTLSRFFREYGIDKRDFVIDYIGLRKEKDEPPAGFFRQ